MKQSGLRMNVRVLRLLREHQRGLLLYTLIANTLQALLPYILIWFSAKIIRALTHGADTKTLVRLVILALVSFAVPSLIMQWAKTRSEAIDALSWHTFEGLILLKKLTMDFQDLEDPKIKDLVSQIRQNQRYGGRGIGLAWESMKDLYAALIGIIGAIVLSAGLFAGQVPAESPYAWLNHPFFVILLFAVLIAAVIVSSYCRVKAHAITYDNTEIGKLGNRIFNHFSAFGIDMPSWGMDIRIYEHHKLSRYYSRKDTSFSPKGALAALMRGRAGGLMVLAEGIQVMAICCIYVYVCMKALGGAFGIGEVTQYAGAITTLTASLYLFFNQLGKLRNNAPHLKMLFEFLDLPNRMGEGTLEVGEKLEIVFDDVSFQYPGEDKYSLRHVSFRLSGERRFAIVGQNGSGKTTCIKLLCRMYDPTEGRILLNGRDIREYSYQEYLRIFSVVFQDFKLLSVPIGQNVAVGTAYDDAAVKHALTDAGFGERLSSLQKGLATSLHRDFDEEGIEPSGGEAQKIAIARALYKKAPLIILDEPTAALDPIAEAEIYSSFDTIAQGHTVIYISHRLSSCRFCDEILVFDQGHIVQQGTHASLLIDPQGPYAALWNAQAQYYA